MPLFNNKRSVYDEENEFEIMPQSAQAAAPAARPDMARSALQMKMIRPRKFIEARTVADSLKAGQTIVLNLEDLSDDIGRRMLDYIAGVIYAVNGTIERPAEKTFLLTPSGIDVDTEKK